jgi:UDP-N-acetylmuramyl pentapeptide phosphotransferase/UDP-N-acetylglucosamine-1-phosphate transferase
VTNAAALWGVVAAAFFGSLLVVRLLERHAASLKLLDEPNARSSHVATLPRGGGLGIVIATLAATALAAMVGPSPFADPPWRVLSSALLVAAVGLVDDVIGLAIWPRLAVQAIGAATVVSSVGGFDRVPLPAPADLAVGEAGALLAVLWIVTVTNFFNFMDGVDGLAGGQAVISFGVFAWVLWPHGAAGLAGIVAAATAGFLLRNWSPAKIFLGDVGSAFLGFLLAALPLAGPPALRGELVFLIAISLTLFLLDPVATLFVRGKQGAKFGAAHRQHAYQQLVAPGTAHAPLVIALLAVGLGLALAAAAAFWSPALRWPVVALAVIAFAVERKMASGKAEGKRQKAETKAAR